MPRFTIPFTDWRRRGLDAELRDLARLVSIEVEAPNEDEAVATVKRVLSRWNVDFTPVLAGALERETTPNLAIRLDDARRNKQTELAGTLEAELARRT